MPICMWASITKIPICLYVSRHYICTYRYGYYLSTNIQCLFINCHGLCILMHAQLGNMWCQ